MTATADASHPLRWERGRIGDSVSYTAYCGSLTIGWAAYKTGGGVHWRIDAITPIGQRSGNVASMETARAAITRAWRAWLKKAGLDQ